VHASAPVAPDSRGRNALSTSAEVADASIKTATQHVSATVDASHFAELAASGFFDSAAEADVDKALDDVLRGLRAVEGLEEGRLIGHVSKGFASADFTRLVGGAVKAKLKAEAKGLIRARLVGKTAPRDEFDRFALNAAAAVEAALGLVYRAVHGRWRAVARVDVAGRENYVYVDEELAKAFDVRKKGVVHYLRYEVGDVVYGDARAEGVVVLMLLGGEKSIRVEVLAKSVAGLPASFEEVRWSREKWLRLATAKINKPSGAKNYVAQVEPRLVKVTAKVGGGAMGVEGLRGLLVTDASGKEIKTPDPLLVKLFMHHFEKVKVEVTGVSHTKAGLALIFRAVALDDKPFRELFGGIAENYDVKWEMVAKKVKGMWLEAMRKLSAYIKRVADEVAEVGKKEGVETGRRALVEGLRRLFEEREREALNAGRRDEALTIAVAGRLLLDIVNGQWEWLSLLVGDGTVDIGGKTLGFTAKYAKVADTVLHLLKVWAGAYEAEIRVKERAAMYSSAEDAAKVLRALLTGDVLGHAISLAKSWSGLAGSNAPKLISLLALAQLLGVVEDKWAVELWLAHKAATTLTPPDAAKALEGLLARVESVDKAKWEEGGINVYFRLRGVESNSRAAVFRLHTDFVNFYLYCDLCSEATAERVLGVVAEELRPIVEQLGRRLRLTVAKERPVWPRCHGNALALPASVGWPIFLELWKRYNMSLRVPKEGRELLRVEVLDVKPNGEAKFRLWYHKWDKTRPDKPYVDVEIKPQPHKDGRAHFIGYIYANVAEGILREHLAEIGKLLEHNGVKGVAYYEFKKGARLQFTGAFRDSVLAWLGIRPELPPGEPPAVQYLGGFRFRVGDREVEFGDKFNAKLIFQSRDEAERLASSLKAAGVYAKVAGYTVKLDRDSFFGLLAATGAVPPGLTLLYRSEEDDFRLYASAGGGKMRFYFAVKHEGVWRVAEGLYSENNVELKRKEREVLEAIRGAVARALAQLSRSTDVGEPKEKVDEEGNVEVYYLYLYTHHLAPFLEHAADSVEAKPAEVRLKGRCIIIRAGGVEKDVEFELLKRHKADYLFANDIVQTLALYKSLKAIGVPVEITPEGVRVDSEAMWTLIAAAVERNAPSELPTEVMPSVELLKMYSVGGMKPYAFRASEEGVHFYFAVKTGEGWRAAGGKQSGRKVDFVGEAARAVADAINTLYGEMGMRRVEVKYDKMGTPYIRLTNEDLRLLGLSQHEP